MYALWHCTKTRTRGVGSPSSGEACPAGKTLLRGVTGSKRGNGQSANRVETAIGKPGLGASPARRLSTYIAQSVSRLGGTAVEEMVRGTARRQLVFEESIKRQRTN